ncbi:MAG: hypothetical protein U1F83_07035, partial [Verrucomicrobiota bacterium]
DLLVLVGLILIYITVGKVKVRPHFVGKIATVLQMVCVLWILLGWDIGWGVRWIGCWSIGAALCTGASGLLYVWDGVRQLSASPSSSAVKSDKQ